MAVKGNKAKLSGYLQEISSRGSALIASEAIVEPNPSNPNTVLSVLPAADLSETLVSCRLVPTGQYIYAKLGFPWVGSDYCQMKYPKVGEQVIVVFLHGDINSAVIISRLPSLLEPIPVDLTLDNFVQKDEHGNQIVWDATGTFFTDAFDNTVTTDSSGVLFIDAQGNSITTNATGVSVEDTFGNIIELTATGVKVTDFSGNEIETSASGISITAPTINITGNVVVTGEVTANGIPLSTHVHTGVTSGPANTGTPIP